jgi:hypothetical protein
MISSKALDLSRDIRCAVSFNYGIISRRETERQRERLT